MKLTQLLIAVLFAFSLACQQERSGEATATTADTGAPATEAAQEKTYTMNGKLVSRDAAKNEVTIDNEDVPGVMAPMVMAYELRGARVDDVPPDGTQVTSTLHEQDGKYWVTDVKPRQ